MSATVTIRLSEEELVAVDELRAVFSEGAPIEIDVTRHRICKAIFIKGLKMMQKERAEAKESENAAR